MLKFIRCFGFFHRFEFVGQLSEVAMRVRCSRCTNHYAVNMHMGAVIRWSPKVAQFYERFGTHS